MLTNTRTSYSQLFLFIVFIYPTLSYALCESSEPVVVASGQQIDTNQKEVPKQRKRRRKKKEKKAAVSFNTMTYEQLIERKNILVAENNLTTAIKFLKRILTLCKNANDLADHMIELADLLFKLENYKKAVGIYRDFIRLYPGDSRIEYALYRAVCSSWKCTHSPDRDQTPTHETIELAKEFLRRKSVFKNHVEEVKTILADCYKKLVESELNICSFYRDRGQTDLMEKRFAMIEEDWGAVFEPTKTMILAFKDPELLHDISVTPSLPAESSVRVAAKEKSKHMARRF